MGPGRRTWTSGLRAAKGSAFRETREYVEAVLEAREIYARVYANELELER